MKNKRKKKEEKEKKGRKEKDRPPFLESIALALLRIL